jgi:hypothetical protein
MNINVLWKDLSYIYEQALKKAGLNKPHKLQRNKYLRWGMNNTEFIEKRATKNHNGRYVQRVHGKIVQYTCIKLPTKSGVKLEWTKVEMREVITRALSALKLM